MRAGMEIRNLDDTKRNGKVYTPRPLADFLAERTLTSLLQSDSISILDPACGDGELLIASETVCREAGFNGQIKLTGCDTDPTALKKAQERLSNSSSTLELIEGNFLEIHKALPPNSFNAVITNPPYVRTQHLGSAKARQLATEFNLKGRVDLTHAFVAACQSPLRNGGRLGLLCSNRILSTQAGQNVRRVFLNGPLALSEIYDLGDTKLFRASVLPAVLIAEKISNTESLPKVRSNAKYVSVYERKDIATDPRPLFQTLSGSSPGDAAFNGRTYEVKMGELKLPHDPKEPWRLSTNDSDEWLERVKRGTWKSFGQICKIRVGVKTTADQVFIRSDWGKIEPEIEEELLHPLITNRMIDPWRISTVVPDRILYPYDMDQAKRRIVDIETFPATFSYLMENEERLRSRKYLTESGREWWEIWVPQSPLLWSFPKVVFPDISERPRFAIDRSGAIVNGNCYWISSLDLPHNDLMYLILAVANSEMGLRFYDETCGNRLYSGKRRWITQYVSKMPLPAPWLEQSRRVIQIAKGLSEQQTVVPDEQAELNDAVNRAFIASALQLTQPRDLDGPLRLF